MTDAANVTFPDSHMDLLTGKVYPVLVTLMPDGQPQAQVVWADLDGEYVLINTERSRQKAKNMERNPRVTLLYVDPNDPHRFVEIRGMVESMTDEDGVETITRLSQKYDGTPYFGGRAPMEQIHTQRRVTVRIRPTRIVTRK